MPGRGARILLLGGDADHNIGDRAILSAIVDCISSHDRSAEITVVGGSALGREIPGISRTIARGASGVAGLLRHAWTADRILVAGGGLFQDDDSRAKMPYWAVRLSLLRLVNSQIVGHAIGAGPLRHPESRIAARLACAVLKSISVRDGLARDALAACTSRAITIVPDPAFMLEPASSQAAMDLLQSCGFRPAQPFIAVAVRHWFHERGGFVPNRLKARAGSQLRRDQDRFESLLDAIAGVLVALARRLGAGVLLLPGYNTALEADDVACENLANRLTGIETRIARVADPRLYKAVLGSASLVISSRMHPLILGAAMGTPIVGLSYNMKFDGLFAMLGATTRSLALDDFPAGWGAPELLAAAEAALADRNELRPRSELLARTAREQTLAAAFSAARCPAPDAADG